MIRLRTPLWLLATLALLLTGCASMEPKPAELTPLPEVAEIPDEVEPPPERDIWDRVREGFAFSEADHEAIEPYRQWYARNPAYVDRVGRRAAKYLHYVLEHTALQELPTEIALLPIIESAYHPFAYSHGRASGIWQFIPATARRYEVTQNWWYDGRRDIHAATDAAGRYLADLHDQFDDWLLAVAAYNAGPGNVRRALAAARRAGEPETYWGARPWLPNETQGYVPKLLAIADVIRDPEDLGLELPSIPDEPRLVRVTVEGQMDLALAADLAGLEVDELYRLNPGFNRWATSPDGPHHLLLPAEQVGPFHRGLAALPDSSRTGWERHRIREGESLRSIARSYQTTTKRLRQINDLKGNTIRSGDYLMIPVALHEEAAYTLTESARTRAIQNRKREGRKVTIEVQAGDSLWSIADQHDVDVRELASWNAMAPGDPLRPGQQLVVWTRNPDAAALPQDFRAPHGHDTQRQLGYTVRQGDSLARISRRFNVSVEQLRQWNNLDGDEHLQPGQELTLYVDVTEQSGSS
ncbi:LysM peptidoglycan-binding domain-containing protein [Thiohalospira sp.]|uniref:LysM peptidoglycan-binding domain-containing protein n=1 Tax=Thiohalospira sp. TaxID=3080549 RepID=UPI003980D62F